MVESPFTEDPLVSVIIPTFQREKYIGEAVRSALSQTYRNLEVLVIDDGSTDSTKGIIDQFGKEDSRLRYIRQENRGPASARNAAIGNSKGPFIAFLDSDERWFSEKIKKEVNVFREHPEVGLVYCNGYFINENGERNDALTEERKARKTYTADNFLFEWVHFLSTSGITIRRECLQRAGIFDESLPLYEDVDLWFRILLFYPAYFIDEELVVNRKHSQNYAAIHCRFPDLEMSRSIWLMRSKATDLYELHKRKLSDSEKDLVLHEFHLQFIKELFATGMHEEARKELSAYRGTHSLSPKLLFYEILSFFPERFVSTMIRLRRRAIKKSISKSPENQLELSLPGPTL